MRRNEEQQRKASGNIPFTQSRQPMSPPVTNDLFSPQTMQQTTKLSGTMNPDRKRIIFPWDSKKFERNLYPNKSTLIRTPTNKRGVCKHSTQQCILDKLFMPQNFIPGCGVLRTRMNTMMNEEGEIQNRIRKERPTKAREQWWGVLISQNPPG